MLFKTATSNYFFIRAAVWLPFFYGPNLRPCQLFYGYVQTTFTHQNMPCLRQAFSMAQKVEKDLGNGSVLQ
jgi:hypothetical protein